MVGKTPVHTLTQSDTRWKNRSTARPVAARARASRAPGRRTSARVKPASRVPASPNTMAVMATAAGITRKPTLPSLQYRIVWPTRPSTRPSPSPRREPLATHSALEGGGALGEGGRLAAGSLTLAGMTMMLQRGAPASPEAWPILGATRSRHQRPRRDRGRAPAMPTPSSRRALILAGALAATVNLWLAASFYDRFWWPADEGNYAHVAERVLDGEVLNRDVQDIHLGYVNFLHAGTMAVFGRSMVALRYPLMAAALAQAALAFFLFRRFGAVTAALAACVVPILGVLLYLDPTAHWYSQLLCFVLVALLERLPRGSRWRDPAAGFVVGLMFCFRQLTGVLVAIGLVAYLLSECGEEERRASRPPLGVHSWGARAVLALATAGLAAYLWKKADLSGFLLFGIWPVLLCGFGLARTRVAGGATLRRLSLLLAGALAAGVPLVLYHVATGSLGSWYHDVVVTATALTELPFIRGQNFVTTLVTGGAALVAKPPSAAAWVNGVFWALLPFAAAALGLTVAWRLRRGAPVSPLPWLAVFYAVVSVHFQNPTYLYFTIGTTALGGLWLAAEAGAWPRRVVAGAVAAAAAVALGFHAGQTANRGWERLLAGARVPMVETAAAIPRCGLRIDEQDLATYTQALALIEREVGPDESIFALPSSAELSFPLGPPEPIPLFQLRARRAGREGRRGHLGHACRPAPEADLLCRQGQVQHAAVEEDDRDPFALLSPPHDDRAVGRLSPRGREPMRTPAHEDAGHGSGAMSSGLISVVMPAHDEAASLARVVERTLAALAGEEVELIVVDDGSTDGTWSEVTALAARHPEVRGLRLARNFGHQAALVAGLTAARGEAVVMLDADGQHPPELLPAFVERWRQGFAVVQGVRQASEGLGLLKRASSRLFYRLMRRLAGVPLQEGAADFRLLSRPACDAVLSAAGPAPFLRGLLPWLGLPTAYLPFAAERRLGGETSYTFRRMLRLSLDGILGFSVVPLRLASALGALVSLASFAYLAYVLAVRLTTGHAVPGWASTAGLLSLLGGIQLLTLGILGEYLGRVFTASLSRPLYVVAEKVGT